MNCKNVLSFCKRTEWFLYKKAKKLRLHNDNFTIISSNCNGSAIYYDLNKRFLTPTINLSFDMNDYVKMLANLKWYMAQPIMPYEDTGVDYPLGTLGDIIIRFNHYSTFEEAVNKWNERKKRINWDNLFILGTDADNCTYQTLLDFDKLPYENKVIFTHKEYPEIKSSYYIKGFENKECLGPLIYFRDSFFIRRYIDDFDYISFLNNAYKKENNNGNS